MAAHDRVATARLEFGDSVARQQAAAHLVQV